MIYQLIKRCKVVINADDTALSIANRDIKVIEAVLQDELSIINNWFTDNELIVNCSKTNAMLFGSKQPDDVLQLAPSRTFSLMAVKPICRSTHLKT